MSVFYSGLRGREEEFRRGWPILMYHKLGPAPSGCRMRGLYVTRELLQRQLREWKAAGGQWRGLDESLTDSNGALTITFDDGFTSVLREGLEPLREVGCVAIQYLVPGLWGATNLWDAASGEVQERLMEPAEVREWLAAGHRIGAHTMTHPRLTTLPLPKAREEITASKKALEDLFGLPVDHFAYPFGDYNAAVSDLVQEAGFRTATTTEAGVNGPADSPWRLKRMMARHPSRKLLRPWTWLD